MKPDDPVPRLLRLHAMARRTAPSANQKIDLSDAAGLYEGYVALRESARALAADLGVTSDAFDAEVPPMATPLPPGRRGPQALLEQGSHASTAAARLRLLRGYLEGLLEMAMLTEDLSNDQVARIRGAFDRG